MAFVVVGAALQLPWPKRQQRLGGVERLNLLFLIHAQDQGVIGRRPTGTTSLFAALELKTSKVIAQLKRRDRSVEFRQFLDVIEAQVPAGLDVHIIVDNYGTTKPPPFGNGSPNAHDFTSTTPPPTIPGSTWWSAGSPNRSQALVCTKTADQILASIARYAQRRTAA
jgi:hypothetical protein